MGAVNSIVDLIDGNLPSIAARQDDIYITLNRTVSIVPE